MKPRKLPVLAEMKCDPHCGDCCEIVPCNDDEYRRVKAYVLEKKIPILEQGLKCPFYLKGKCAVYEVRPMVCVLFGHVEKMQCVRGYNVNDLNDAQAWKLINIQKKPRHLHELVEELQSPVFGGR